MSDWRLVKHRGKYALAYGHPRKRISTGTADRGRAEAIAGEIWRRLSAPPSDLIADVWQAYVKDRKQTVARADRFDSLWAALGPRFGHRLGTAITAQDCRDYYRTRKREGMADSTIKTELEFLRACLRFKYGAEAPRLWLPPSSAPRDRYLTKAEARALLEHIEAPHVRLFVLLAITTGARMSAILELTWDQVDLRRGTVDFRPAGRHQTNKRRTVVPLNEEALAELHKAKEAGLSDHVIEYAGKRVKSIKKAIRSASARAGIPASPHVFRHTAGVWMAEADIPMQKIAQYLGHTTTAVTERTYARYSPSFMRDASQALRF